MKNVRKIIAQILILSLLLFNIPFVVFGAQEADDAAVQIVYSPVERVYTEEVINISADIESLEGVELVRIYFKMVGSKDYYFVPMIVSDDTKYSGFLPAPTLTGKSVEYLFLVKTYNNRIFKSQTFTSIVLDRKNTGSGEEPVAIDVSIETKEIPPVLVGFDRRTRVRTVTKPEKHGVVAGLYEYEEAGGTSSNGQYHGTQLATEKSYLNTILIGGGVLAGVAAIAAILGSSGSEDGGSSSSSTTDTDNGVTSTGAGLWTLTYTNGACTKSTTQTVACSDEGLVTSVSPTAIGIPLPDACDNSPYNGLSEIFIVGGSCDTATACGDYAPSDLESKTCNNSSMVITKDGGSQVESWGL